MMSKLNLQVSTEGKKGHSHVMEEERLKALKNIADSVGRVSCTMCWSRHLKGKGEKNEARKETHKPC